MDTYMDTCFRHRIVSIWTPKPKRWTATEKGQLQKNGYSSLRGGANTYHLKQLNSKDDTYSIGSPMYQTGISLRPDLRNAEIYPLDRSENIEATLGKLERSGYRED